MGCGGEDGWSLPVSGPTRGLSASGVGFEISAVDEGGKCAGGMKVRSGGKSFYQSRSAWGRFGDRESIYWGGGHV